MSGLGFTIVQDGALGKPHVTVMVDGTQAQFKPLRPSKTLDIQYNVVGVRVCMRALSRSELTTPCFCRACCRIQLESGQDATSLTSLRSKRSGKGSRADLYVVCLLRSARGQGSLLTFLVCLVSVGAIESIEPLENPKNLVPRGIQLAGRRSRPRRPSRKLSRSCPLWRQALALVLWLPPLPTRRARRCLRTQPPLWHSTVRRAQPPVPRRHVRDVPPRQAAPPRKSARGATRARTSVETAPPASAPHHNTRRRRHSSTEVGSADLWGGATDRFSGGRTSRNTFTAGSAPATTRTRVNPKTRIPRRRLAWNSSTSYQRPESLLWALTMQPAEEELPGRPARLPYGKRYASAHIQRSARRKAPASPDHRPRPQSARRGGAGAGARSGQSSHRRGQPRPRSAIPPQTTRTDCRDDHNSRGVTRYVTSSSVFGPC